MALTKAQKQKIVEDLREKIAEQKAMILIGISGLKVKDISDLRKRLKAIDAQIKVVKKTLTEIIFKEKKLAFEKDKFKEEIALVFGFKDEISLARTVYQFSQSLPAGEGNLKILGGFLKNKFKETDEIITLAQIPTREELLARLAGSISAPVTNFVRALEYNLKGLVYVLSSIKK